MLATKLAARRCPLHRGSNLHARSLASLAPRVSISPLDADIPLDYDRQVLQLKSVRHGSRRPLTLTEKVLYSHLCTSAEHHWSLDDIRRGETLLHLRPDRVACHDATATMALLQFISAGLPKVQIPTTVHSDHLIVSRDGAEEDLVRGRKEHREVYAFLSSAAKKYGIGWWKPGAGIIHTTIFENYAFPGGLIIGTDSHTPNAGGMGMLGIGVGGSDAVDAMAGMPWELMCPQIVGVRLTGSLHGWASTKDIICKLAGILSVSGGKGKVIEFFGPGTQTLGATAMATVCNMSAEIGSTSCIFPYSEAMNRYLSATKRADVARFANGYKDILLTADEGSEKHYDTVIEIDLDSLEPHVNGPFTPDLSHPLSELKDAVAKNDWPVEISHAMVGSCTNSSYEDLYKTSQLVEQAKAAGLPKVKTPFLVSPGSEDIRATAESEGILQTLRDAGAVVLSTTCGPCVGQWQRTDVDVKGRERNTVVSSFNRNFVGRHDGNPETCSFVTSPEMVTAFAYSGRLDFNPIVGSLPIEGSPHEFQFTAPRNVELPMQFVVGEDFYQAPVHDADDVAVDIDPQSERLQLLEPFKPWSPGSTKDMPILVKVQGKCTTDHISPAGPWYKFRGHLENISNNMLLAASNAFLGSDSKLLGHTTHPLTSEIGLVHEVARDLRDQGVKWCIIGDFNYGEGSSREHAALEPRFLGGVAIIARSFARIHETNLKKQGMLPLTFAKPQDYDRIQLGDRITLQGVEDGELRPGRQASMRVVRANNAGEWIAPLNHSYSNGQLKWLRAGSALNHIKQTVLGR
ncbi:aconitase family-domain-containing protein [Alternaria rosae]|uniref:aconitase family-domain-containing protein n=1 Tax=Alternaria rosae TaxID=1187941 RepID=UPI001E8D6DA4|nr:aconitase family-domain-containing protein [Alternaria rosae]KAH6875594.1 aconitase family-domain-containing protein [Alternaria rosae]